MTAKHVLINKFVVMYKQGLQGDLYQQHTVDTVGRNHKPL